MVNNMWGWVNRLVGVSEDQSNEFLKGRLSVKDIHSWNPNENQNLVNLKQKQAQTDAAKIAELQQIIANWEWWKLWKMARVWLWMSVVPDSIDEVWPRFEYSQEDAQKYLNELNKKYPIKDILGKHYDEIVNWELSHVFQMSFIWDAWMESKFYELVKKSAQEGKWVWNIQHYWTMEYIRNVHPEDKKTWAILEHDVLWFSQPYPEVYNLAEKYREIVKQTNSWWKLFKLVGINFKIRSVLKKMDHWSMANFENRLTDIQENSDKEISLNMPIIIFPKEHLIQDLMKRLKTSLDEKNLIS